MNASKAVARTMIEMAAQKNIKVTNLTLQKLLYFAHGLMLVRTDKALINEGFQAWKYGPVVESLYHDLKIFGPGAISPEDGFIDSWPELNVKAVNEREAIKDVLDALGDWTPGELIDLSHEPDGPWSEVFNSKKNNIEIPDEKIKEYFRSKVEG